MSTWRYVKGDEKDFDGFSDEVIAVFKSTSNSIHGVYNFEKWAVDPDYKLIASRSRLTNVNDDRLTRDVDSVNHPSHYTQGGIECIDAIKSATVGKTGIEAVAVANVIKYLWRYEEKNGLEDIKKAAWYIEYLIKQVEGGSK